MTDTPTIDQKKPANANEEHPEKNKEQNKKQKEVRPAGPHGAGVDPQEWDIVDEESDESFPASDAPSHY